MKKGARKRRPTLWVGVWEHVSCVDGKHRDIRMFTVAATKVEAVDVLVDGLMGLRHVEGASTGPKVWRVPTRVVAKMQDYALYLRRLSKHERFFFVVPHDRLTDSDVSELIGRLVGR